jgi:hypothetical protein
MVGMLPPQVRPRTVPKGRRRIYCGINHWQGRKSKVLHKLRGCAGGRRDILPRVRGKISEDAQATATAGTASHAVGVGQHLITGSGKDFKSAMIWNLVSAIGFVPLFLFAMGIFYDVPPVRVVGVLPVGWWIVMISFAVIELIMALCAYTKTQTEIKVHTDGILGTGHDHSYGFFGFKSTEPTRHVNVSYDKITKVEIETFLANKALVVSTQTAKYMFYAKNLQAVHEAINQQMGKR